MAVSVMCVSLPEGVPPCLRSSPHFHLRWLGPVAQLRRVVSQFPSGGLCGCCPCSRLAAGFPPLVGFWFAFLGLWLSALLPPASPC